MAADALGSGVESTVGRGDELAVLQKEIDRIADIMRDAGLRDVDWFGMSAGIVTIHTGTVPESSERDATD